MKAKFFFFIALILSIIFSCEKEDSQFELKEIPYQEPYEIEQDLIIGRGYDIFDNYADVKMVRGSILDYNKMLEEGVITKNSIENAEFKTITGNTIDTYLAEMAWNAGVDVEIHAFSASVDVNFNRSQSGNSSNSFATVQSTIDKKLIKIKDEFTNDDLKAYLSDNFKEDLNNSTISPEELFDRYGTHCLSNIIIGGRLDYNISVNSNYIANSSSLAVQAEAEYKNDLWGSAGASGGESDSSSDTNSNEHMEKRLLVYGGKCEYGQNIINDDDYTQWIESVEDNSVFCDFGKNAFIPIWEFCNEETRLNEIKGAFTNWGNIRSFQPNCHTDTLTYNFCIMDWAVHQNCDTEMNLTEDDIATLNFSFNLKPSNDGNISLDIYFHLTEKDGDHTEFEETKNLTVLSDIGFVNSILGSVQKEYSIQFYCEKNSEWNKNTEDAGGLFHDWYYYIDETRAGSGYVKKPDGFINQLLFKIDDNGFDWGKVGLKGELKIPVSILNE